MLQSIEDLFREIRTGPAPWLLLLDIDGTLIDTGGQGMAALNRTAEQIFGGNGPKLDLAGSTDLGVFETVCSHFDVEMNDELLFQFFQTYHENLVESLEADFSRGRVLEGVVKFLEDFDPVDHVQLALLTGNTESGSRIKLQHYQLDRYFFFGAYGSDRADRNLLGPIAVDRALAFTGVAFPSENVLVIGDTPKDIRCAHALGARCVAVATGAFSQSELLEEGADWVIGSLEELG